MLVARRVLLFRILPIVLSTILGLERFARADDDNPQCILVSTVKVRFRDRVSLNFMRTGIVSSIEVREGNYVNKGDRLAGLKDEIPKSALAVAQREAESDVEIRIARNQLESANLEYKAVVAANSKSANAFSETEVARLRLAVRKAELELEHQLHLHDLAELRFAQADQELQTYHLYAPFDGLVTKVKLNLGEEISQSDSLIELVGTKHIVAEGYVSFEDAQQLAPGSIVEMTVRAPLDSKSRYQRTYRGVLRFVDVAVQQVRGVVRVIADFELANEEFKDGLSGEMKIFQTEEAGINRINTTGKP